MYCNKCGEKINDEANVCQKCGCEVTACETKPSRPSRLRFIMLAVILPAILALGVYALYSSSDYALISSVKSGSFADDKYTIGEIFSEKAGLKHVKWSSSVTKDDKKIVQVTGIIPNGKMEITTQFQVGNDGRFRIYAMEEKDLGTNNRTPLNSFQQSTILKVLKKNLWESGGQSSEKNVDPYEANKGEALNSGKAIAQAWDLAARGERSRPVGGDTIYDWVFVLAQRANLNDPNLWILDFDPNVKEAIKKAAVKPSNVGDKAGASLRISPEFKSFPLSWEVANLVPPNAPGNTPILWTRGLKSDGKWDKDEGVFGDKGGFIVFADMSVKWFDSLRDDDNPRGVLKRYGETMPTFDINGAVRGGSKNILKSK